MTHPAYLDMLAVVEARVRPPFRTDLTRHDHRALHAQDNVCERPFVWAAHEAGTFLCFVDVKTIDGVGHKPAEFPTFVERAYGECEWFIWDGVGLQTCSVDGAIDFARTFEWCAS